VTYNRTVAGDRFSPLAEITPANVSQLREICRYALPEVTSLQTGPIVIQATVSREQADWASARRPS
jgi:alcohol dehydrogenase (cytochrome c)